MFLLFFLYFNLIKFKKNIKIFFRFFEKRHKTLNSQLDMFLEFTKIFTLMYSIRML